jgi:hypothetical protein
MRDVGHTPQVLQRRQVWIVADGERLEDAGAEMSQVVREHCGKTDFKALLATLVGISIAKALPELIVSDLVGAMVV